MQLADFKISNDNLTDPDYIEALNYPHKHYLKSLFKSLWEFIKSCPVHLVIYATNQDKIIVAVGDNVKQYDIDNNISYFDFIYKIRLWVEQFYPQFTYVIEEEVPLTNEEMHQKAINENTPLHEVVFSTKVVKEEFKAMISKINLRKDEFIFEISYNTFRTISRIATNEKDIIVPDVHTDKQVRMSGTPSNILPLSKFMNEIRKKIWAGEDGYKIYKFLLENSEEIHSIDTSLDGDVEIEYPSNWMKNFFIIHFNELKKFDLVNIPAHQTNLIYRWGKYVILFPDEITLVECLEYYKKRQRDQKIIEE